MKDGIIRFFASAGKGENGLSKEEHRTYLNILDDWLMEVPVIRDQEMQIVLAFIDRMIRYYLIVCAKRIRPAGSYEGCMENLIFLIGYLLHYYFWKVGKEYLQEIYALSIRINDLNPCSYAEVADYVIHTGLPTKIHFFIEYYFPK